MMDYTETPDIRIPLADGRCLAARLWLPISEQPVPAIVEYLPYRKRDGTAMRDESTYPVFATHGYAGVRVDIAGHGESDGIFDDEYSTQELNDGVEVIHWIASQPWCDGKVGIMGISWGGFNALQLGAIGPSPLKAAISLNSVVDRYNDDIHCRNGAQLSSNFGWANMMLAYASRAPDPSLRQDWRNCWLKRLESLPWLLPTWLSHQRRDAYWQHGSICEDFANYRTPTMIIGGWADLYKNASVTLLQEAPKTTPVIAINGPWIHKYPHFAFPHPRLDFHKEALRWWDRWLKQDETQEQAPVYRAFVSENTRVQKRREREQGRWVAFDQWPPKDTRWKTFHAGSDFSLSQNQRTSNAESISICSPQDCGISCGEIFTLQPEGELPADQRIDFGGSLVFKSAALESSLDVLGAPIFTTDIAIDKAYANLIVRLLDIHPDGMAHRISWGVLNLAHRHHATHGYQRPTAMTPGQAEHIVIQLDQCAYRLLPGHRLGLAISTAYWPAIQPPPFMVTANLFTDNCQIKLPCRDTTDQITLAEPSNPNPLPVYRQLGPGEQQRQAIQDMQNRLTRYVVIDDTGLVQHPDNGIATQHRRDEQWQIDPEDPLSAKASSQHTFTMVRDDIHLVTATQSQMSVDEGNYYIEATLTATENGKIVHQRCWHDQIARDFT